MQYLDAYSANQRFYREDSESEIVGSYALAQGVPTILPYEPFVEWQNTGAAKNDDVARREISLVGVSDSKESYCALRSHTPILSRVCLASDIALSMRVIF